MLVNRHFPASWAFEADLIQSLDELQVTYDVASSPMGNLILAGDSNSELPRAATVGRAPAEARRATAAATSSGTSARM